MKVIRSVNSDFVLRFHPPCAEIWWNCLCVPARLSVKMTACPWTSLLCICCHTYYTWHLTRFQMFVSCSQKHWSKPFWRKVSGRRTWNGLTTWGFFTSIFLNSAGKEKPTSDVGCCSIYHLFGERYYLGWHKAMTLLWYLTCCCVMLSKWVLAHMPACCFGVIFHDWPRGVIEVLSESTGEQLPTVKLLNSALCLIKKK